MAYSDGMRMLVAITLLLGTLMLGSAHVQAAESGNYYVGAYDGIDVKRSPTIDAGTITHLNRLRNVRIEARERSWAHIATINPPHVSGWVPDGALRQRYEPPKTHHSTSSFFSGLAALFGGGDDETKTAVLGVRGLDNEGSLGNKVAPAAQVKWMEGLHVSDKEIADFVHQGRLNP